MKKHFSTILLVTVFIVGLSLLLYPTVSNYWNAKRQSYMIADYSEQVRGLDEDHYREMRQAVTEYNRVLNDRKNSFLLDDDLMQRYQHLLDIGGTGIMGYIVIPSIDVSLPIYHGVDEGVLQVAVGHLEWSSLPGGGPDTHCVLSGHRGLPTAKLFTHLDKLQEGDLFMMQILDQVLTYEVDQILIVEPNQVSSLLPQEGQDLCTLVTCTPYGVNSHRLLVRGHRVESQNTENIAVTGDAIQIDPTLVAPALALPILLILLIVLMLPKRKR